MRRLLEPESIAIIGASPSADKPGTILLRNLLDHGFRGPIYPIHPTAREVLGLRAYPSISAVPAPVDLVFVVVPRSAVADALRGCVARKVKGAVIVSAGFGEVGGDGPAMELELRQILAGSGVAAIGPNTIGLVHTARRLVASFVPFSHWTDGPVAIAAQSGNFVGSLADELMARATQRLGIRLAVAFGNKIDVDEVDFLDYAAADPEIRVVGLHLESLGRPRAFLDKVRQVTLDKPVIVLKTGRTHAGAMAAASHTGALAIEDRVLDAALRQVNAIRARNAEDFLALLKAFSWAPIPKGPGVGIVTFSGANGVMASDDLHEAGLSLPDFAGGTVRRIARLLPDWAPVRNPADVWLALGAGRRQALEEPLLAVLDDPAVDSVLGLLLALPNTDFPEIAAVFAGARQRHPDKPIFLVLTGGATKDRWLHELEPVQIPVDADPSASIRAIRAMLDYASRRQRRRGEPAGSVGPGEAG